MGGQRLIYRPAVLAWGARLALCRVRWGLFLVAKQWAAKE